MSSLKILERDCFEGLFEMSGGYVMDFSNRTFSELIRESANIDIYSNKYAINGESKAKRLRTFLQIESDPVAGKVLSDLMEYWRYKTPQPDAKQAALAERANATIRRLTGKQAADSADEFLKQNFGSVSLQKIPTIGPLATILEARFAEAVKCLKTDCPLAAVFLCGSILEGLLLGLASANPEQFTKAPNSPKDKAGAVKKLHAWTLAQLIDVSCELGYLGLDVKKFSHALRDFRNYIHPYAQLSSGFAPDKHTAEICLQVLKAAIASLGGARKS
jgi:hypothetical protein